MQIADALRLLRIRQGLTQTAASQRKGAPDFRTLSHWETRRKLPSLRLLNRYLDSQGYDFHDLQDALDQMKGVMPKRLSNVLKGVEQRLETVESRLQHLEVGHLAHRSPGPGEGSATKDAIREHAPEGGSAGPAAVPV